jgi:hypothetical protein
MNAEISALQKQNLALTKSNDDLRNRNGLKSREQQKQLEDALTSAMDRISADDEKHKREIFQIRADCDKRIMQAEDHAAEIESRCARDNEIAAKARKEGEEYRDRYKQLLADEEAHIDELAERKIAEEKAAIHREQDLETARIKKKYDRRLNMRIHSLDARYMLREWRHDFVFEFCIVVLLIQACSSTFLRGEAAGVVGYVKNYIRFAENTVTSRSGSLAENAATLFSNMGADVAYWLVLIIMTLVLVIILYAVPMGIVFGGGYCYIKSKKFDKYAQWIMIASGIAVIAISSECVGFRLPVNVIILWMLIQTAFPVIRYIIIPCVVTLYQNYRELPYDRQREIRDNMITVVIGIATIIFILWAFTSCVNDVSEIFS